MAAASTSSRVAAGGRPGGRTLWGLPIEGKLATVRDTHGLAAAAHEWNAASRSASTPSSRRADAVRRPNGSSRTRPRSYFQVPATSPSTRNVFTECGVLVLKTTGR